MSISRPIATALAAAGLAGVLVFGLSACSPGPGPKPSPTPSASAEPIFESDEEALAAAVKAYEAFLEVSAHATSESGANDEELAAVASGQALDAQLETVNDFAAKGLHSTGTRMFSVHELQKHDEGHDGASVTVYICDDLRPFDILDSSGKSAVAPDRVNDVPYLVVFEGSSSDHLLVTERTLWDGSNFCL
ncbi:hypothetical protein [Agromyces sp. NPDC055658]